MQATPSVDQNDERQENMPENYDENLPTNIEEDNRAQYLKIIPKDKTNDKRIKARFTSVIRKLKNKLKKKELEK